MGRAGVYSFNGNKIMTTSGGGMLVSDDASLVDKVRYWSTQSREPVIWYEHREVGFNYRLSNLLAAVGRAQLARLPEMSARRKDINAHYRSELGAVPGLDFMPELPAGRSTRWLTCLTVDPTRFGATRELVGVVVAELLAFTYSINGKKEPR